MTVGWGVVGCGWAAGEICRAIDDAGGARIIAVHDREAERAAVFSARHGADQSESLEALCRRADVDVVYIALPHSLLAPTAQRALAAGKHVLVEKPMGLDVEEIRALEHAAHARSLIAAPVFELRTKPVFAETRELVKAGTIGEIKAVRIRTVIDKPGLYWSSAPWRARLADAGGGVVLMNSIHQLDLVRHVTGLDLVSVVAETATLYADVEVEDSAAAVFRLSNGAIVSLAAAAHSPGAANEERIELDGARGRIDLPDPSANAADRLRLYAATAWEERLVGGPDAYVTYVRAFLAAVRGGAQPPATPDDAAAAVAAVAAVYRSAVEGRRVEV
jgi:UDP-N-acetyl-2-amino-2-deoxyglucuronate dehydrogenase